MDFKNRWKDNIINYQKPPREYVTDAMMQIEQVVRDFCEILDLDFSRIKINIPALEDVIVRTDMRVLYFAIYHKDMKPNEYKRIAGLMIFWILKRHPFWLEVLPEDDESIVHVASCINEKIALHIAVTLLHDYNSDFFEHGEDLVNSYTLELEYSFTYRDLSKESLFLMFDPFYYEHIFSNSYKEDSLVF